eukprot:1156879-Pelagomonas_calceolata.AAC.7
MAGIAGMARMDVAEDAFLAGLPQRCIPGAWRLPNDAMNRSQMCRYKSCWAEPITIVISSHVPEPELKWAEYCQAGDHQF